MWSTSGRGLCIAANRSVAAGKDVATSRGVAATRCVAATRDVPPARSPVRIFPGNFYGYQQSRSVSTHKSINQTSSLTLPRSETEVKRWLFPVDDRLQEMVDAAGLGYGQGARMTIRSAQPISPEQVKLALQCLFRKAEAFRSCFHERGDELWVVEMLEPFMDFKVIEETCLLEQMEELIAPPCSMNDQPMFGARMIVSPQDDSRIFPHQYHLLLNYNHAMHDGVIMYMSLEWIFKILDDIVSGRPIDDSQLGTLRPGVEAREEEEKVKRELLKDPDNLSKLLKERAERNTTPLLIQAFGHPPDEAEATTGTLERMIISGELMENFKKKCQSVGATLNSGFLGLHNAALVEVVKEAGLERESYDITSNFPVDTRRYMSQTEGICFGFHGMPLIHTMTTPHDIKPNFWRYVQELDVAVRWKLKNKQVFKERVLGKLLRPDTHATESSSDKLPALKHDYTFSNTYFSRTTHYGIGRSIRLADWSRYNLVGTTDMSMLSSLTALEDQGLFQVTYSSRCMTERNAIKLNESIIRMFHDIAQ